MIGPRWGLGNRRLKRMRRDDEPPLLVPRGIGWLALTFPVLPCGFYVLPNPAGTSPPVDPRSADLRQQADRMAQRRRLVREGTYGSLTRENATNRPLCPTLPTNRKARKVLDKPKRPMLQEAAALLTVALVVGGAYVALNWGDAGSVPATTAPPRSATTDSPPVAEERSGLGRVALNSLASEVASTFASGDEALAAQMIQVASQITGCNLHGFTGGPTDPPGLSDLAKPRTRAWIRQDAANRGLDVGFGHDGETWIVIAQACGGEDLAP